MDMSWPPKRRAAEGVERGGEVFADVKFFDRGNAGDDPSAPRYANPSPPSTTNNRPTEPSKCCGRWPNPIRNLTVNRSRNPLISRERPYLERPKRRARCWTTISPTVNPRAAASTGTKRWRSP